HPGERPLRRRISTNPSSQAFESRARFTATSSRRLHHHSLQRLTIHQRRFPVVLPFEHSHFIPAGCSIPRQHPHRGRSRQQKQSVLRDHHRDSHVIMQTQQLLPFFEGLVVYWRQHTLRSILCD